MLKEMYIHSSSRVKGLRKTTQQKFKSYFDKYAILKLLIARGIYVFFDMQRTSHSSFNAISYKAQNV